MSTNKTKITLGVVIAVLVIALVSVSAYQYQTNRKPAPTESTAQLTRERNDAVKALQIHDGVNKTKLDTANKQAATLQTKLTAVCTHLTTLKASDLSCQ